MKIIQHANNSRDYKDEMLLLKNRNDKASSSPSSYSSSTSASPPLSSSSSSLLMTSIEKKSLASQLKAANSNKSNNNNSTSTNLIDMIANASAVQSATNSLANFDLQAFISSTNGQFMPKLSLIHISQGIVR